ncbi:hypothetical protein [Nonomuraea sp. NPDC003804]
MRCHSGVAALPPKGMPATAA